LNGPDPPPNPLIFGIFRVTLSFASGVPLPFEA